MADNLNELKMVATLDNSDVKKKSNEMDNEFKKVIDTLARMTRTKGLSKVITNFSELKQATSLVAKEADKAYQKYVKLTVTGANASKIKGAQLAWQKATKSLEAYQKAMDKIAQPSIKSPIHDLKLAGQPRDMLKTPVSDLKMASPQAAKGIQSTTMAIKGLNKELNKNEQATNKSSTVWGRLMGRIRNIAIYRAIRTGLKWITSGVSEGLNNLAQYSSGVNDTMSNLNGSLNQIKNTMGIAFASVLQALEPLLTTLADGLVNIVNSFNLAMAKMSGQNTYTKAKKNVEDYAASLKKAQKFSFDSFEVLSGGDEASPSDMFEEGDVNEDADELSDIFGQLLEIIKEVGTAIGSIWKEIQPIIKPLLGALREIIEPIKDIIISLIPPLTNIITTLLPPLVKIIQALAQLIQVIMPILTDIINAILPFIEYALNGIADAIGIIADLLAGDFEGAFEHLKSYFKDFANFILKGVEILVNAIAWIGKAVVNGGIGAINTTIDLINIALKPIDKIAGLFGAKSGTVQIPKVPYLDMSFQTVSFPSFANGGFTTANFIATNENGKREWVGRNAGATAVVNDTQMSDIMYQAVKQGCYEGIAQAIYDTNSGSSDGGDIVLQVDNYTLGKVVASSQGFKAEATRIGLI